MGFDFTVADIPPSADPDTAPITSGDPTCKECGIGLFYGGRGRKPEYCDEHKPNRSSGTRSTGRRSAKDVESAMAALDSAHTSLTFVLMLLAGDAAKAWEDSRSNLDERNRKILEMDPALAKRLSTAAAKGGAPALVISHLVAIAPAAAIAMSKVKTARAAKPRAKTGPQDSANGAENNGATNPLDPDAIFRR